MANSKNAGGDRRRKLERVRTEIEKYIAGGRTLVASEWIQRYPDLNPELGELLARLTEGQQASHLRNQRPRQLRMLPPLLPHSVEARIPVYQERPPATQPATLPH